MSRSTPRQYFSEKCSVLFAKLNIVVFMKDFTLCCIPHKVCNDFGKHKGKRATVLHLYTILITGGVTYFCYE